MRTLRTALVLSTGSAASALAGSALALGILRGLTVVLRGLDADPALVVECGRWSEAEGARALRHVLGTGTRFTALVAGNDLIALGCYDVFAEQGISCPEDVSVIGFNDMPFLDKMRPPLTTVAVPHHQIGMESARMLLESINEADRPARSVLLPLKLMVRGSTAPPAGG